MKVVITSLENEKTSKMDPRFGRCAYFAIYDTVSKSLEFIENPSKDVTEGAGPATVQLVAEQQVKKIITGHFGDKVIPLLKELNIEMHTENNHNKTVEEIINTL